MYLIPKTNETKELVIPTAGPLEGTLGIRQLRECAQPHDGRQEQGMADIHHTSRRESWTGAWTPIIHR